MEDKNNELLQRITRAETNIENLKENFARFSAEVREDYIKLLDEIGSMKTQITKIVVVVTILSQGAGQLVTPIVKVLLGL